MKKDIKINVVSSGYSFPRALAFSAFNVHVDVKLIFSNYRKTSIAMHASISRYPSLGYNLKRKMQHNPLRLNI